MVQWVEIDDPIEYLAALKMMEARLYKVVDQPELETVFILEHQDVYTAGVSFEPTELLNHGKIPVYYVGRGGKFTYHGPGQVVIYPILNLSNNGREKDIRKYISNLELLVINSLKFFNIKSFVIPGKIGVWVKTKFKEQKIAAIGVRIHKWVTYHGAAINICPDMKKFAGIIPCGMDNSTVTSTRELGVEVDLCYYKTILKQEFHKIF